ncbi:MAG: hypothetical protein LBM66_02295 [Bifidobacteriaceae bacterium]|jgi:hypothetical protein|nr:hypothetical protein [Bifidobacteriaceae bacterium]
MLSFDRIREIGRRCLAVGIVLIVVGIALRLVIESVFADFVFHQALFDGGHPLANTVSTVIDSLMLYATVPAGALMAAAGVVLGWFGKTRRPGADQPGPAPAGSPASLVSGRSHVHSNPTQI